MNKQHWVIWKELESYESDIFGYIKNAVVDAEIARDLCQDVFIIALRKIDELDPEKDIYHWLKVVSRNRVINFFRERKRRQYVELSESTIRTEVETGDLKQTIGTVIKQMPRLQKEIFILRELEGYSYKELAQHFKRSESAVTSLLKRARLHFTRLYLLEYLPEWFRKNAHELSLEDIGRFINAFDPPLDLLKEIHKKSQAYFESIRQSWNLIRRDYFPQDIQEEIISFLGGASGRNVLDLGCGSGAVSIHCASLGKRVTGVDVNAAMLRELAEQKRSLGFNALYLVRANINRLPMYKREFDEVFINLVLHHVSDPFMVLRQVCAVLKPAGCLIVVEFDRHINRQMADAMHDLWLGFKPSVIENWCAKLDLYPVAEKSWQAAGNVRTYYRIFRKKKT